jgi:hypothetical protein
MNPDEREALLASINEALQKHPTSSAFHLFGLSKHYCEKAQLRYFPQKGNAVNPIDVEQINKQLKSYHEFRDTVAQFEPVSVQTTIGELNSIMSKFNKEKMIGFDPKNYDIRDLNRQVQAYVKYKGITIAEFATNIDPKQLAQEIQKINKQKPIDTPTLAKLNQQIETFCLYKDKTEDEKMSLKLSEQSTLGVAGEKIQEINQENLTHYEAYQDFFKFTNEHMKNVIDKYLDDQDPKLLAQKIDQLSNISRLLIKMGDYNVSAAIMMKVLEKLSKGSQKETLKGLISEETKTDIKNFEDIATKIFQRHSFYSGVKSAIPRVELVEKTEETVSGYLGNIGATNLCIQNLEMLKSEMETNSASELNRSSDCFKNLPESIQKELNEGNLNELMEREKQKHDEKMLTSGGKLIEQHRSTIDGLSKSSHFDVLKEIMIKPVQDYVNHFDEKGTGGAGFFSRHSPVTTKKKQAANDLIDKIKGANGIENLEEILIAVASPEQLSSGSKKPQLLVIRDEALEMLEEYNQYNPALEPALKSSLGLC